MIPPIGSIVIGPCPQCKEFVVIFCGQVLPLEKAIMEGEDLAARRDHLLSVLTEFLRDRIGKLMHAEPSSEEGAMSDELELPGDEHEGPEFEGEPKPRDLGAITQQEVDRFTEVDLKLLDNKAYFKSVFEK